VSGNDGVAIVSLGLVQSADDMDLARFTRCDLWSIQRSRKDVDAQWGETRADPPQSSCRAVCGLAEGAKHFTASPATSNGPHGVQLWLCHLMASIFDKTSPLLPNTTVL
jgi:hypothetical protein